MLGKFFAGYLLGGWIPFQSSVLLWIASLGSNQSVAGSELAGFKFLRPSVLIFGLFPKVFLQLFFSRSKEILVRGIFSTCHLTIKKPPVLQCFAIVQSGRLFLGRVDFSKAVNGFSVHCYQVNCRFEFKVTVCGRITATNGVLFKRVVRWPLFVCFSQVGWFVFWIAMVAKAKKFRNKSVVRCYAIENKLFVLCIIPLRRCDRISTQVISER